MTDVANFIAGHEGTQSNRVCYNFFYSVFLASVNFSQLMYDAISRLPIDVYCSCLRIV